MVRLSAQFKREFWYIIKTMSIIFGSLAFFIGIIALIIITLPIVFAIIAMIVWIMVSLAAVFAAIECQMS
jgi:hypothetical protein